MLFRSPNNSENETDQFSVGEPEKPTSSETPNSTTPKPVKYDGEAEWTSSPFDESFSGHDYKHGDKTKSPFNKPSTGDSAGWSSTPWK